MSAGQVGEAPAQAPVEFEAVLEEGRQELSKPVGSPPEGGAGREGLDALYAHVAARLPYQAVTHELRTLSRSIRKHTASIIAEHEKIRRRLRRRLFWRKYGFAIRLALYLLLLTSLGVLAYINREPLLTWAKALVLTSTTGGTP